MIFIVFFRNLYYYFRVLKAVRTKLELVSVTLCITTIFITLFLLCSQFVASIEYFEST